MDAMAYDDAEMEKIRKCINRMSTYGKHTCQVRAAENLDWNQPSNLEEGHKKKKSSLSPFPFLWKRSPFPMLLAI
jgi:hypothetical protein